MTTTELFNTMVASGTTTRETMDNFFRLLSVDTLDNQIAMTLIPNDGGTIYTTITAQMIEVTE